MAGPIELTSVLGSLGDRNEEDAFRNHIESARRRVDTWPAWKIRAAISVMGQARDPPSSSQYDDQAKSDTTRTTGVP